MGVNIPEKYEYEYIAEFCESDQRLPFTEFILRERARDALRIEYDEYDRICAELGITMGS